MPDSMSTSRSSNMLPWHFSQVYIWTLHGLTRLAVREKVICRSCDIRQETVNLHLVADVQKNWRWKFPLEATTWIKGKKWTTERWMNKTPQEKRGNLPQRQVEKLRNEFSDCIEVLKAGLGLGEMGMDYEFNEVRPLIDRWIVMNRWIIYGTHVRVFIL